MWTANKYMTKCCVNSIWGKESLPSIRMAVKKKKPKIIKACRDGTGVNVSWHNEY